MNLHELSLRNPLLVDFFPPPSLAEMSTFKSEFGQNLPDDLMDLWIHWGTGTVFETEEFFSPTINSDTGDSGFTINREMRMRGLPPQLIVFHRGLGGITCISDRGEIVQVDEDSLHIRHTFESFDDWFNRCLVREYEVKYGIQKD